MLGSSTAEEIKEKRGARSWYANDQNAAEVMNSGSGDGKNFGWGWWWCFGKKARGMNTPSTSQVMRAVSGTSVYKRTRRGYEPARWTLWRRAIRRDKDRVAHRQSIPGPQDPTRPLPQRPRAS